MQRESFQNIVIHIINIILSYNLRDIFLTSGPSKLCFMFLYITKKKNWPCGSLIFLLSTINNYCSLNFVILIQCYSQCIIDCYLVSYTQWLLTLYTIIDVSNNHQISPVCLFIMLDSVLNVINSVLFPGCINISYYSYQLHIFQEEGITCIIVFIQIGDLSLHLHLHSYRQYTIIARYGLMIYTVQYILHNKIVLHFCVLKLLTFVFR